MPVLASTQHWRSQWHPNKATSQTCTRCRHGVVAMAQGPQVAQSVGMDATDSSLGFSMPTLARGDNWLSPRASTLPAFRLVVRARGGSEPPRIGESITVGFCVGQVVNLPCLLPVFGRLATCPTTVIDSPIPSRVWGGQWSRPNVLRPRRGGLGRRGVARRSSFLPGERQAAERIARRLFRPPPCAPGNMPGWPAHRTTPWWKSDAATTTLYIELSDPVGRVYRAHYRVRTSKRAIVLGERRLSHSRFAPCSAAAWDCAIFHRQVRNAAAARRRSHRRGRRPARRRERLLHVAAIRLRRRPAGASAPHAADRSGTMREPCWT